MRVSDACTQCEPDRQIFPQDHVACAGSRRSSIHSIASDVESYELEVLHLKQEPDGLSHHSKQLTEPGQTGDEDIPSLQSSVSPSIKQTIFIIQVQYPSPER